MLEIALYVSPVVGFVTGFLAAKIHNRKDSTSDPKEDTVTLNSDVGGLV